MVVSIVSNNASDIARRNLEASTLRVNDASNKISSGQRVFEAKEDAAALSIGTALKIDVASFRAAQVNVSQGTSLLQIADASLGQLTDILNRMNVLANTSVSDQLSSVERQVLDTEYQTLLSEFDRIVETTDFNGVPLLGGINDNQLNSVGANIDSDDGFVGFEFDATPANGDVFEIDYFSVTNVMNVRNTTTNVVQTLFVQSPQVGALATYNFDNLGVEITLNSDFDDTTDIVHAGAGEEFDVVTLATAAAATFDFQVGTTTAAQDRIDITLPVVNSTVLGLGTSSVDTRANALNAKIAISSAVDLINTARANVGASLTRLETANNNIAVAIENSELARSALLDADVAQEVTEMTSQQTLAQAGVSILSQANAQPDVLLGLLRNSR